MPLRKYDYFRKPYKSANTPFKYSHTTSGRMSGVFQKIKAQDTAASRIQDAYRRHASKRSYGLRVGLTNLRKRRKMDAFLKRMREGQDRLRESVRQLQQC